jgi:hypothetical protein
MGPPKRCTGYEGLQRTTQTHERKAQRTFDFNSAKAERAQSLLAGYEPLRQVAPCMAHSLLVGYERLRSFPTPFTHWHPESPHQDRPTPACRPVMTCGPPGQQASGQQASWPQAFELDRNWSQPGRQAHLHHFSCEETSDWLRADPGCCATSPSPQRSSPLSPRWYQPLLS